jgi:TolB-like protein/DNA-binding winged helix-turn-helix (wHTH) protein
MDSREDCERLFFEGYRLDRFGLLRVDEAGVGEPVAVGSRALDLLLLLAQRDGEVVSKDAIMGAVWPGAAVEESNLTVQISALRRVLDQNRGNGSCIQTIPGRGYRFVPAVVKGSTIDDASPETAAASGTRQPFSSNSTLGSVTADVVSGPSQALEIKKWRWLRHSVIALAIGLCCLSALVYFKPSWLPRHGATIPAPRLSIVVLPFVSLDNNADQRHLADAITHDLITHLSRLNELQGQVVAYDTAKNYYGTAINASQIRRELGVRYILKGTMQRANHLIRMNVQLIDATTSSYLWTDQFEGETTNLFALQDDVTRRIANGLNVKMIEFAAREPIENSDAQSFLLKGRVILQNEPSVDDYKKAVAMFEQALTLDPSSIRARLLLAHALTANQKLRMGMLADTERAEGLIEAALAVAPDNPFGHQLKGRVLDYRGRCGEALVEFQRALELNSDRYAAYAGIASCKLQTGAIDEAIEFGEKAIRITPVASAYTWLYHYGIGVAHLLKSSIPQAISSLERANSLNSKVADVHLWLAAAFGLKGEIDRAVAELAAARRLIGTAPDKDRYASIGRLKGGGQFFPLTSATSDLFERTVIPGLRNAGMLEE